jgi:hypothetical protein
VSFVVTAAVAARVPPAAAGCVSCEIGAGASLLCSVTIFKQSAARAAELAAKTIDKHIDPKRLPRSERFESGMLQGPSTFRDARKDRAR